MEQNKKPTILLIDDDKSFCNELVEAYKNIFLVKVACNKQEAREMIISEGYNLVLLDLCIDNDEYEDGFELIKTIRTQQEEMPICIVTKVDKVKTVRDAFKKYEINEYLPKKDSNYVEWVEYIRECLRPKSIVFLYSEKDDNWRNEIEEHLVLLKRNMNVSIWSYETIDVGENKKKAQLEALESANVIIALYSVKFLASDELCKIVSQILRNDKKILIPVYLSPCERIDELVEIKSSNEYNIPLSAMTNHEQDEALTKLANDIRVAVKKSR